LSKTTGCSAATIIPMTAYACLRYRDADAAFGTYAP
jgi:hypothetical protein